MKIRTYFITGLLIWLPIVVTVVLFKFLIELLDVTLLLIPEGWRPEDHLGTTIPGLGVVFTLLILMVTGLATANIFGQRVVVAWESILERIPLVRSVYSSANQVIKTVLTSGQTSFRQVVMVQFPAKGNWVLGLVTGIAPTAASQAVGQKLISVVIPTTPNPTSGYLVMVPEEDLLVLPLSVEEGLTYVISMGVVTPDTGKSDRSSPKRG